MTERQYPDQIEVVVLTGEFKGEQGVISSYVPAFDTYMVALPARSLGGYFAFQADEIQPVQEEQQEEPFEAPGFGMTEDEFVEHLEFLLGRTLSKIPSTGTEQAFFGYQEFEGLTAEEVLLKLLDKLEDGIAYLAQAHILISRIGVSYRMMVKELTDEGD